MRLHEQNPGDKTEKWRARNERRQPRLGRFVETLLGSTAPASNVGSFIGLNINTTTPVLQKRVCQRAALADESEAATISNSEAYILPVKRPQERKRRASSVGATQLSVETIPTPLLKAMPVGDNKFEALRSNEVGLFGDAQHNALPVRCTLETHF